ncbi:MAG TPA: cyanophycinase [Thermoanaerobaculia bacterium]|nr:cyanophycinase [Thermoanaerobaculia bacterium]
MKARLPLAVLLASLFASPACTQAPAPAAAPPAARTGNLVLIGGGDKPDDAMRKFVELAGGPDAPIVAIPTASSEEDAADYYERLFREKYGCTKTVSLRIKTREDAARADYAELAGKARGVFFGGGDQVRITKALLDTPVGKAIAEAYARGAVVGGTSAGTACQSKLMITGEGDFTSIRAKSVEVLEGLGFFPGVVVDQHFVKRQRENRLFSVILEHPELLGVGVDETAAIWVRPDRTFQVMGKSSVMVFDAAGAAVARQPDAAGKDLLGVHGLKVHVLLPGEVFDLTARKVVKEPAPK